MEEKRRGRPRSRGPALHRPKRPTNEARRRYMRYLPFFFCDAASSVVLEGSLEGRRWIRVSGFAQSRVPCTGTPHNCTYTTRTHRRCNRNFSKRRQGDGPDLREGFEAVWEFSLFSLPFFTLTLFFCLNSLYMRVSFPFSYPIFFFRGSSEPVVGQALIGISNFASSA